MLLNTGAISFDANFVSLLGLGPGQMPLRGLGC